MWDGYIYIKTNKYDCWTQDLYCIPFWTNKSLVYLCNIFLLNKNGFVKCYALDIMIKREIHEKNVSLVVYFYNLINLYT